MTIRKAIETGAGLTGYVQTLAERASGRARTKERATFLATCAVLTDPTGWLIASGGGLSVASLRCRRDGGLHMTPNASWSQATTDAIRAVAASVRGDDPSQIIVDGSCLIDADPGRRIAIACAELSKYLRSIGEWTLAQRIVDQADKTSKTYA